MTCDTTGPAMGTIQHNGTHGSKVFIGGYALGVKWMGCVPVATQHGRSQQPAYDVVKGGVVSKSTGWPQCRCHQMWHNHMLAIAIPHHRGHMQKHHGTYKRTMCSPTHSVHRQMLATPQCNEARVAERHSPTYLHNISGLLIDKARRARPARPIEHVAQSHVGVPPWADRTCRSKTGPGCCCPCTSITMK